MSPKIDYKEVNKLIELMEKKKLSNFELEIEGLKIKISRNIAPVVQGEAPASLPAPQETETEEKIGESLEPVTKKGDNNLHHITSPMVGTFYRSPDPSSPPFVEINDRVKKNQTLCIIEAMKLMNEIESDVKGIIKEIYAENGKPVEYGQKLFTIQTRP